LHFDEAGAFLLGLDLGQVCTKEEADLVEDFLTLIADFHSTTFASLTRSRRRFGEYTGEDRELERQVRAFIDGFRRTRPPV